MESVGVIGVGEIGRAIVEGLCEGGDGRAPEVFLSPRGAATAAGLAERHGNVRVCAGNQEVVDRAGLVIVAVRPAQRHEALSGLRVPPDRIVVNVMAGVGTAELRGLLATEAALVRAIPLPPVRERASVTVTCPPHPAVDAFFGRLGGALPVEDEAIFDVFSALTATLTTHYRYLVTLSEWAAGHGVPAAQAERYVRGLFHDVGRSLADGTRSLHRLAADHETPNGSNERIRTTWFGPANAAALTKALDDLLADLGRPGPSR
ncbi:NAD(P)-binding domain-containing protein [Actinomadura sp. ATCC 31491]|uniref:NAD(P)-binding domain-containing protein n=1 Tax=Actinomadura luzonensis TaxID=2805427 RepID=A0ABT0FTH9_9ACTN|nr:NAD(P)-binding domain-containing protein [Actinomadura luzonensis]MCK2215644.1 NAD(P)-binding domain-containing protein [Actinomadura luzonensis]